ncbi:MAG: amidohydrolase family protein, partial [bacterium]|nr:amidohydrolase family protein [bacterium]
MAIAALVTPASAQDAWLLRPDRVFDGTTLHEGWAVLVRDNLIEAAGADVNGLG